MNTKNFKCFQILYEEGNLSSASRKLFLSPQGLGKMIKNMEDEIGTSLFIRSKEGFLPTESGKIFYEKSKEIDKSLNDLMSDIAHIRNGEKRFRIGLAAGVIRAIDVEKLHEFMDNHTEIVGRWYEHENGLIKEKVLNGELGLGIVIGETRDNNLNCVLMKSIEVNMYVYKNHPFWDREYIDLSEVRDEKIITMNSKYHVYHDFVNACHLNGFNPNIVAHVSEGESIYQLVKHKVGIGVSPKFFPDCKDVKGIRISGGYTWDICGIYRVDGADNRLARSLISHMK